MHNQRLHKPEAATAGYEHVTLRQHAGSTGRYFATPLN
jgi:hypothetical protein